MKQTSRSHGRDLSVARDDEARQVRRQLDLLPDRQVMDRRLHAVQPYGMELASHALDLRAVGLESEDGHHRLPDQLAQQMPIAHPEQYTVASRITGSGKHRREDFAYPGRTGLHAETGSFYWWNRIGSIGELGYWYADRHFEGVGNVLFMDAHVGPVETPYPNAPPDDLRDPG